MINNYGGIQRFIKLRIGKPFVAFAVVVGFTV